MFDNQAIARDIALHLAVLDHDGSLQEMDSLTVLDFVTEIENRTGKTVPTTQIRRTNFESLQAIAALIQTLP